MNITEVRDELRAKTRRVLPPDWKKGLKCPECEGSAERPKCMYELGADCPRHNPENYEPSPFQTVPDARAQEMADAIDATLKLLTTIEETAKRILERGRHRTDGDLATLIDRWEHMTRGDQDCIYAQRTYIDRVTSKRPEAGYSEGPISDGGMDPRERKQP